MLRNPFWCLVLMTSLSACSSPAVKPQPTIPKAPPVKTDDKRAPSPPEKTAPVEPPNPCNDDPSTEAPVVQGEIGEGKRLVRVLNEGEIELRVRLLDKQLKPVYPGTLRVLPGEKGEFMVGEGIYHLRYRLQSNCEVRRGSAIRLMGQNWGYEKVIKTHLKKGSGLSKKVDEAL